MFYLSLFATLCDDVSNEHTLRAEKYDFVSNQIEMAVIPLIRMQHDKNKTII